MSNYLEKRLDIVKKRRNIMVLSLGTIVLWIFSFMATSVSFAELKPSDYTSLFQIPQVRTYCSNESVNSQCSIGGNVSLGTCGEGELAGYPYCCAEAMTGFKNLYNFSDPRIFEQIDSGVNLWSNEEHYRISAVAPSKSGTSWGACEELSAFRVFVPPGTTHFNLTLYLQRDDEIGMVARFKEVPECEFCDCGGVDEYENLPTANEWSIVLDEETASKSTQEKAVLATQDVYQTNMGGHISISFGFSEAEALTEERAGWLFVRMIPCRDNEILNLRLSITVNGEKYKRWFSNADWDICGDPWMTGAPEDSAACTPSAPSSVSPTQGSSGSGSSSSPTQGSSGSGSSSSPTQGSSGSGSEGGVNSNPLLEYLNRPTTPNQTNDTVIPLPHGQTFRECDSSCQNDSKGARVITAIEDDRIRMKFSSPPYEGKVYVYAVMTGIDNGRTVYWNDDGERGYIQDFSEVTQYWTGNGNSAENIHMDDIMICAIGLGGEKVQVLTPGTYVLCWMIATEGPEIASCSENDPYELLWTTIEVPECR